MRAVITGGSKGIGRAVAVRLARPGARLLVNYVRDGDAARRAVGELRERGAAAEAVRADALDPDGAAALAAAARSELGGVDALVHCAVEPIAGPLLDMPRDALLATLERNGTSLLWLVRESRDLMPEGAAVVFLTSRGARKALPGYAPLGPAKALGEALVRYLAAELAPRGVRVNAVSAGAVDTDALRSMLPDAEGALSFAAHHTPGGRALTVDDVAAAVSMLLEGGARMVQGEVLQVDGGLEMVR